MNSSNTASKTAVFTKEPADTKINGEYLSLIFCGVSAIALVGALLGNFGTLFNGNDTSVNFEDNLWVKTVTPVTVCLLVFGLAFYFYFIRMNKSNAQLAIFCLSFLSLSLSMLALAFSLFQVSVTKV
jgi:hypothetical protein